MSQMIYNITLNKRDNLLNLIWLSQLPTPIPRLDCLTGQSIIFQVRMSNISMFSWCGCISQVGSIIAIVIANYYIE